MTTIKTVNKFKVYNHKEVMKRFGRSEKLLRVYYKKFTCFDIAAQLIRIRKKSKMTQAAVAKKAKMPQSVIARIESGRHSVSLGTLNRIAHALGKRVQLV